MYMRKIKPMLETFQPSPNYPKSPFLPESEVENLILFRGENAYVSNHEIESQTLLQWLCSPPTISSFRVNTLVISVKEVIEMLKEELIKISKEKVCNKIPHIHSHSFLPDVVIIESWPHDTVDLQLKEKEVVVDSQCAAALLRGSHIFAPGVMSMHAGSQIGDYVSVYVDLSGKCKRGLQVTFNDPKKVFIGNGILKMIRKDLFNNKSKPRGIAVYMTDTISGCPSISENCLPNGFAVLQNLPSIVCSHVLNPKPNEIVLDMCAAPGNKTIHIAALMKNSGTVIALEKIKSKISEIEHRCQLFSVNCVKVFNFDSTKALSNESIENGPPFQKNTFDKILLDAPCSGLGQRPQLCNKITMNILKSYSALQKKLFSVAVELLKVDGTLVYSTCTITVPENEAIVSWALKKFPQLQLIPSEPRLGNTGWKGCGLSDDDCEKVQRYGPPQKEDNYCDSVGFFIACFKKCKL